MHFTLEFTAVSNILNTIMICFILRVFRHSNFCAIACLLYFSSIFYPTKLLAEDKPVGQILSVIGTVEIFLGELGSESKGKPGEVKPVSAEPWQKVKKKQPVYSKDRYRSSRKSRLKNLTTPLSTFICLYCF